MDILELRNFLQSEGVELNEVAIPIIDITEDKLLDICDAIESDGLDNLIKNLGTISNAFKTENDFSCSPEVLAEGVKLIHVCLERLCMEIATAQGDTRASLANIDRATRFKFRRYMAVLFFLVNQSFMEIESMVTAEAANISLQMAGTGGNKRKGKRHTEYPDESKFQFWSIWRPKIVQQLWKLVEPPMHEMWEGNIEGGYNFMRCLTLALCTTIKNKSQKLRNSDDEVEEIFEVMGVLALKHGEQKAIMARLIPLLKGSEETANIIAAGIDRMIKMAPEQAQNIVLHALSETIDTYMARFGQETGQERGFHAFLTQLCTLQPKGAMHSLPVVVQFLESESQIVRNAVLVVAYELMKWSWGQMNAPNEENFEDQGERVNSHDNWLPLRRKLLDEILLHHMRDSNSFVRTKAMNLLSELAKARLLVPTESVAILKNVKLRLLDKTVTARKAATSLVIDLVKYYPHIVTPIAEYVEKREKKIQEIVATIQRDTQNPATCIYFIIKEFHLHSKKESFLISSSVKEEIVSPDAALKVIEESLKEGQYWRACEAMYLTIKKYRNAELQQVLHALQRSDDDSKEEIYLRFFKGTYPDLFPEDLNVLDLGELNYMAPQKVQDERSFLDFMQCLMKMNMELDKCQPSLRKLLELGTTTDKKEAVMFYSAICEAGFVPSQAITVSIINALSQLTAAELKDFVDSFKCIFIGTENTGPVQTVKKLLDLVEKLSENLVENLGGMIGELYRSHVLTNESVNILWDAFSLSTGSWNPSQSRCAAYILGIIGQIEKKVVTSNLAQLIDIGLGERAVGDFELAKVTLQTILYGCRVEEEFIEPEVPAGRGKRVTKLVSRTKASEGIKFPPSHDLFAKILVLVEHGLKEEGTEDMDFMYPKVVELSMQIIYRMCTEPSEVVSKLMPNIHSLVFGASSTASQSQNPEQQDPFKLSEKILFRYMSFGKALLGAHITFYEQIVTKEIKMRKAATDKIKKKKTTLNRQRSRTTMNGSSINSSLNQSNQDAANEMDLVIGNIGFDAEADNIKTYVSKLLDQGFFRNFRVHVLYLCQVFNNIKSVNLKVSVVQALTKLMLICEASVQNHLKYLLKLWKEDETFAVKLEILKASIRLTIKFPNQMEKMNEGFSAGLTHADARVRKASMDYIEYLALSDLLKVREQLSDCAACLCDESFELREMARDFISQIAEKDNVLQNCIPDIISRLSAREDITQDSFQIIMKTLLNKIKKEKQLGGLVERIVCRFKGPVSVRVCQDTAFCLTQIQQNDKTLKIMKDNLNIYADKLGDEDVWESFMTILESIKKLQKADLKTRIEEWEKDLEENHAKCVALNNAQNAAKRKNEKPQRVVESESSSEEEAEENEENDGQANENGEENEEMEEEAEAASQERSLNQAEGMEESGVESGEDEEQEQMEESEDDE